MNPLAWARAEILHTAWKRGLYVPPDRRVLEDDILRELACDFGQGYLFAPAEPEDRARQRLEKPLPGSPT